MDRQREREGGETDRQINKQTNRQTDRQTGREKEREREKVRQRQIHVDRFLTCYHNSCFVV